MTDRLKIRYKKIKPATKDLWDKSVKYIVGLDVKHVDDDIAANYLENAEGACGESTVKCHLGPSKKLDDAIQGLVKPKCS